MDRGTRGLRPGHSVLLLIAILASLATDGSIAPRQPGPRSACPVCGMFVAPHPGWLAQIVFDDGTVVFFDGCKDLFTFLNDPGRYAPRDATGTIAAIFVTGYYDQTALEARRARFVAGSDVYGPMGAELIPLRNGDEAEEFKTDHHGRSILRFEEVDDEILADLR